MSKMIDRWFGWLLLLGAVLHGYGSLQSYSWLTPELVWALAGTLAIGLLAAINLLRVSRPGDRALAWVSFAGCAGWLVLAFGFGVSIGAPLDPRVLYHVLAALVLAAFSLRAALMP